MRTTARDVVVNEGRPQADNADRNDDTDQAPAAVTARPSLQLSLRLEDEPAGAEQSVAEHQRHAGEERERREEVKRSAGERPAFNFEALDE